jgi:alkylation response protein AidB-like acyl-CoA dehydrogenase
VSLSTDMQLDARSQITRRVEQLLAENDPHGDPAAFRAAQYDLGLAWVFFPVGQGGLDLPPAFQAEVDAVVAAAGIQPCFAVNPIGYGMAAPTLLTYLGESAGRYLRPLFAGEEVWCQLFSEPGAGSDVAGVATSAVRDGEDWLVTGQKVWTSLAHLARWGLVLCRTDPDAPKHRGLTYFILDMQAPGVDVRPLRQVTGDAEFNEVFLDSVRIPDSARLGAVGAGWKVALTTLMNERVAIGGQIPPRNGGSIGEALTVWHSQAQHTAGERDRMVRLWERAEVLRLTNMRVGAQSRTGNPGPEGSIAKLVYAELNQDVYELCIDLLGADGSLLENRPFDPSVRQREAHNPNVRYQFLRSLANTIEGGTSEVMRNILGERVLGLPPEHRVDKDIPWRQVPR